jgi:anti-anti-sigma factor
MVANSVEQLPNRTKMAAGSVDTIKKRLYIELNEDVVGTYVADLRRAFLQIMEDVPTEKWNTAYIDLRPCRMIDSMGLNWIFAEIVRLKDADKEVVLRASSPAIARVIEFSGLHRLVTFKFRRRKQTR